MVLLKLIYRVNTETLKNEVSKVKDKTYHEKFSSLSKILGSKLNFEFYISSVWNKQKSELTKINFWTCFISEKVLKTDFAKDQNKTEDDLQMSFQCRSGQGSASAWLAYWSVTIFCADPWFSRWANPNGSFFHLWWCNVADKCCILGYNMYGFKASFFILYKLTFTNYPV